MSDVENAYKQIASFLNNETEKTLLICGIADEEKHRTLLKALNARGRSKGLRQHRTNATIRIAG